MTRLHPIDARQLWAARVARSDQFLLLAFHDSGAPIAQIEAEILSRAATIARLGVAVREVPGHLDYPSWVPVAVTADQVRVHDLDDSSWSGMLDVLATLMADQVDAKIRPWRVHVFNGVADPWEGAKRLCVAVLQISHALADGRGASALARRLFGDRSAVDPPVRRSSFWAPQRMAEGLLRLPQQVGGLVVDGAAAYRHSLSTGTGDGSSSAVPASINRAPGSERILRTLTVGKSLLEGRVTPRVIAAIGDALNAAGLVDGDPVVELTLAREAEAEAGRPESGPTPANDFFMAGIASRTDLSGAPRSAAIARAVDAARKRDRAPVRVAARRAEAATPAALMHWATTGFDAQPNGTLTGHTVVSSVHRGAADLSLGGGRVRLTAGFPALSSVHSLNHGVHGIGDTVTVSVIADPTVVDVTGYLAALRTVLGLPPAR